VLVGVGDHMLQEDIDRVAVLLGQSVVPPTELYRLNAMWLRLPKLTWWRPAHD
jgi:hypothetical protein